MSSLRCAGDIIVWCNHLGYENITYIFRFRLIGD